MLRTFDADDIREALEWTDLIDAIETAVLEAAVASPERQSLQIPVPGGGEATLLLMPAWIPGETIGMKAVTYFPGNSGTDTSTIHAGYLLFDGSDGRLVAVFDGDELTARRTAAASALASKYLARPDARRLLVVGTGQLAPKVAAAHAAVRSFESIAVWGRSAAKAAAVVAELHQLGLPAAPVDDLDEAVPKSDVISCVTGSTSPLIRGALLRPGTHLDLIGSFKADMRESDDDCVAASSVFVDSVAGAVLAGDLAQPLADGLITEADIRSDLAGLVDTSHPGRTDENEITLFKSAGFALEDLVAARLALG